MLLSSPSGGQRGSRLWSSGWLQPLRTLNILFPFPLKLSSKPWTNLVPGLRQMRDPGKSPRAQKHLRLSGAEKGRVFFVFANACMLEHVCQPPSGWAWVSAPSTVGGLFSFKLLEGFMSLIFKWSHRHSNVLFPRSSSEQITWVLQSQSSLKKGQVGKIGDAQSTWLHRIMDSLSWNSLRNQPPSVRTSTFWWLPGSTCFFMVGVGGVSLDKDKSPPLEDLHHRWVCLRPLEVL